MSCNDNSTGFILSSTPVCRQGFYCPNTIPGDLSTLPILCPPSATCAYQRLVGSNCDFAQGKFEPTICKAGFYCPSPRQQLICPVGYYCPTGTTDPIKCDILSQCLAGSTSQQSYTGLVAFLIIDFVLLIIYGYLGYRAKALIRRQSFSLPRTSNLT